MFLFPSGASSLTDHPGWFALLAAAGLVTSFTSTLMFTALGSFYTRISDPDMGGSYLTLLNTIANMGKAFLCLSGRVEGSTIQDRNIIPHAALCVCNLGEPPSDQCKLEGAPCMKVYRSDCSMAVHHEILLLAKRTTSRHLLAFLGMHRADRVGQILHALHAKRLMLSMCAYRHHLAKAGALLTYGPAHHQEVHGGGPHAGEARLSAHADSRQRRECLHKGRGRVCGGAGRILWAVLCHGCHWIHPSPVAQSAAAPAGRAAARAVACKEAAPVKREGLRCLWWLVAFGVLCSRVRALFQVLFWRVVISPFPACKQLRLPLKSAGDARTVSDAQEFCINLGPVLKEKVSPCPPTPCHFFRKGSFHVTAQGALLGKTAQALPRYCVYLFQLLAKAFL